ncbi:hypothetical protein VQ042_16440 [Aurantimonas sp. A2-1-M11]|uniref:hypothetical protein n=1 Tax=Aurantimonas sp. A2-1-M11 TaxID=3113712 RepID=UPI002F957EE9
MSHVVFRRILPAAIGALCLVAAPALAQNRDVTVTNATSTAMIEFYASNTGTNDWEEDILGEDVLEIGESVLVTVDDGTGYCMFDFRATFSDGASATKTDVNVCEVSEFDFTD